MRFIRYVFWNVYYTVAFCPRSLGKEVRKTLRCRSPWWKFSPAVVYNPDGLFWEVWFDDEFGIVESVTIECDAVIGESTGKIVGLKINDGILERII